MSQKVQKNREIWLDIVKGIAILAVIIGHTYPKGHIVRNVIFSFHMPIFFLLTGFTMKEVENYGRALLKDIKRLLLPVVMTVLTVSVIKWRNYTLPYKAFFLEAIEKLKWGNGCSYRGYIGIGVVWFLIILFICKQIHRLLLSYMTDGRIITILIGVIISIYIGRKEWLIYNLDLVFIGLLFMEVGYIYKQHREIVNKKLGVIAFVCFWYWIYMSYEKTIYVEMATREYPYGVVCLLVALTGCVCVIQFGRELETLPVISNILSWLGKNSLVIMCVHAIEKDVVAWNYQSDGFLVVSVKRIILCVIVLLLVKCIETIIIYIKKKVKKHEENEGILQE